MELSEILFYGGITTMATAVLLGVVALVVYKVRGSKLKRRLDVEYGKQTQKI